MHCNFIVFNGISKDITVIEFKLSLSCFFVVAFLNFMPQQLLFEDEKKNILLTFDTTYKGHSSQNINLKFDS